MPVVEKNVLVAHTPAQMFHLVDDVERYPKFLPWCARGEVISRQGPELVASLQTLAVLRAPVDAFFDDVMVNAEQLDLRLNRLGLLKSLHEAMNRVADLSRLAA